MCAGVVYQNGTGFVSPDFELPFSDTAKLELNVTSAGVSIVANSDGFSALASLFAHLAELAGDAPADETCSSPQHWHLGDFAPLDANMQHRFLVGLGPLLAGAKSFGEAMGTGVIFYASGQIGEPFWQGHVESGDSPALALEREMTRYAWLGSASEPDVLDRLGAPSSEEQSEDERLLRFIVAVHEPQLIGAGATPWELSVWIESGNVVGWNLWPQSDESWRPAAAG